MGLVWMCLPFLGSCPSLLWMYHHIQDNTFPRGCYCLSPHAAPALVLLPVFNNCISLPASPPALLPSPHSPHHFLPWSWSISSICHLLHPSHSRQMNTKETIWFCVQFEVTRRGCDSQEDPQLIGILNVTSDIPYIPLRNYLSSPRLWGKLTMACMNN